MIAADCDIDDGAVCTSECRAAIKPFTAECLTNILTNSFFPSFNDAKPDGKAVAAFVEACAGKSAASVGWAQLARELGCLPCYVGLGSTGKQVERWGARF